MYHKYKILHIPTGLYITDEYEHNYYKRKNRDKTEPTYWLTETPTIFKFKEPFTAMMERRLNKILKNEIYYPTDDFYKKQKVYRPEFEIIELERI